MERIKGRSGWRGLRAGVDGEDYNWKSLLGCHNVL